MKGMLDKDPHRRMDMASLRVTFSALVGRACHADAVQVHAWVTAGGAEPLPSTEEVSHRAFLASG